jgi:D-sedoheptulose 7-phosphate isomerase
LRDQKKVLAFGNGGSATQASHLVGELMGRFAQDRQPLAAVALASDAAAMTCIANDFGFATVFERQVEGLAVAGDVAVAFTASGRSENVLRGLAAGRQRRCVTVALTGSAGLVGGEADHVISIPSASIAVVQELHLMFIHVWCEAIDASFAQS